MGSEDIVTKLVLFTIAIRGNTFFETIVNLVQLYKLPLRELQRLISLIAN